MKKSRIKLKNLVPHPRYGTEVIASGFDLDPSEVRRGFWQYAHRTIFPVSAIPANVRKQNYSVMPRKCYVDMLKQCRQCRRSFLFFAKEQKHWFETLGLYVDADCVSCPECRKSNQELGRRVKRYSRHIMAPAIEGKELETLVRDAAFLVEAGYFRNLSKVRWLKNRARKLLPESEALVALDNALKAHNSES